MDLNGKPNSGFIADLPLYHRIPVVCFKSLDWFGDTEFAVWYIRIRDKKRTRTPFDGIIKAGMNFIKFWLLPAEKLEITKSIISLYKFKEGDYECTDKEILDVLSFYSITRDIAEGNA